MSVFLSDTDFSCDSLHDADSSLKVLETEKREPDCAPPGK